MSVYFNDNDPTAAAWLRELYPAATVDDRSIADVSANDVVGYRRVHWFAGIGGWEHALDLAGWPADRPVWTASFPCQPWSTAGSAQGVGDERHLWPTFRGLIAECRPSVVFGEQVASKDGRAWLAGVRADLEALDYAVGAADLCASCVGAPHIRQRLYWVAHASGVRRQRLPAVTWGQSAGDEAQLEDGREWRSSVEPAGGGDAGGLADAQHDDGRADEPGRGPAGRSADGRDHPWAGGLGNTMCRAFQRDECGKSRHGPESSGPWADSRLILCGDGKYRRIPAEPALFPLAHGLPGRVGLLRGAGNSIVPAVAAQFIRAYLEIGLDAPVAAVGARTGQKMTQEP